MTNIPDSYYPVILENQKGIRTMPVVTRGLNRHVKERGWIGSTNVNGKTLTCRLYNIWSHMRRRCRATSGRNYESYAKRGITVCAAWNDYSTFRGWAIALGYHKDLSIDRKDNDGNYEPFNCRWADATTQAQNRRDNVLTPSMVR